MEASTLLLPSIFPPDEIFGSTPTSVRKATPSRNTSVTSVTQGQKTGFSVTSGRIICVCPFGSQSRHSPLPQDLRHVTGNVVGLSPTLAAPHHHTLHLLESGAHETPARHVHSPVGKIFAVVSVTCSRPPWMNNVRLAPILNSRTPNTSLPFQMVVDVVSQHPDHHTARRRHSGHRQKVDGKDRLTTFMTMPGLRNPTWETVPSFTTAGRRAAMPRTLLRDGLGLHLFHFDGAHVPGRWALLAPLQLAIHRRRQAAPQDRASLSTTDSLPPHADPVSSQPSTT